MKEQNEISSRPTSDTGPEPSLELPGRRKTRAGRWKLVLAFIVIIGFGAAALTVGLQRLADSHQEAKKADEKKAQNSGNHDPGTDIDAQKDRIKRDEAAQAKAASEAAAAANAASEARAHLAQPSDTAQHGGTGGQMAANRQRPLTPAERRLQGSVLALGGGDTGAEAGDTTESGATMDAFGRGNSASGGNDSSADGGLSGAARSMGLSALRGQSGGGGAARATPATGDGKGSALEQSLQPSNLQSMQASFRPNRHYLLSRNTMIRCGQATAIRTDRPGLIGCPIAQDVWSDDGTTLLVRKGAIAKGETRDAVMQGQGVIGAIWDEIDDGDVRIPLNSPATDPLGAAGIPAYVDEHFWLRFKGALMVSLIGDFGQALANRATGAGQTITFSNSSNATQEVAAETLRSTINIPPTAYSNQGSVINIFVARDVDLSSVYENVGVDGNEVGSTDPQ
ncbi:TrbI/VirB10 family protein [Paraburkholderia sp. Ac-20340]|uniref:TrbI/VirB10 family protein n=1 Tax=Paraburkholderia sp. Ac-20340 TaxID=2703888 RepID=UPI00197CE49B|nr:TrbI/VirB10 family protein [Paraburkholderia sp. Ac-20340]MBN3856774.1 TrbI/VirB10 family protein [Paraburkholderia sp. Ac-20340]